MTNIDTLKQALELMKQLHPIVADECRHATVMEHLACIDALTVAIKEAEKQDCNCADQRDCDGRCCMQAIAANGNAWRESASDYERGFIDGMQKQAASSVGKAVNRIAQPEKQEPRCAVIVEVFDKDWRLDYMSLPVGKHKLYTQEYVYAAPPQRQPQDWSVFNSGAEVASGLTFEEAWDYMTPERLERGWSAVCVVNQDNLPVGEPARNQMANHGDTSGSPVTPVAWMSKTGHGVYWREHITQTLRELEFGGRPVWKPLYTAPPQRQPLTEEEIDAVCAPLGFAQLSPREVARAIEEAVWKKNF